MPPAPLRALPSPVADEVWERIRQATIDLTIERGYECFEVADVLARAGASRAEFDARFSGLADCRDRVYEANTAEFDQTLVGPYLRAPSWREGLRAAIYGAAEYLPAHRRERHYGELRKRGAEPMALAICDRYLQRLVDLVDAGREEPGALGGLTRATAESTLGSIYVLLVKRLARTGGEEVVWEILPELMYLAVRPYLGQEAALEELRIPVSPPSRAAREAAAVGERARIAAP